MDKNKDQFAPVKTVSKYPIPLSPHSCERCGAGDHPTEDCQ